MSRIYFSKTGMKLQSKPEQMTSTQEIKQKPSEVAVRFIPSKPRSKQRRDVIRVYRIPHERAGIPVIPRAKDVAQVQAEPTSKTTGREMKEREPVPKQQFGNRTCFGTSLGTKQCTRGSAENCKGPFSLNQGCPNCREVICINCWNLEGCVRCDPVSDIPAEEAEKKNQTPEEHRDPPNDLVWAPVSSSLVIGPYGDRTCFGTSLGTKRCTRGSAGNCKGPFSLNQGCPGCREVICINCWNLEGCVRCTEEILPPEILPPYYASGRQNSVEFTEPVFGNDEGDEDKNDGKDANEESVSLSLDRQPAMLPLEIPKAAPLNLPARDPEQMASPSEVKEPTEFALESQIATPVAKSCCVIQ